MSKQKVLVIDDSNADFQYVAAILKKGGYEVEHAPSGVEGLDIARSKKPDCIIMDVVMPNMNGFQATRALANDAQTSAIPVIMLSSKSQKTDLVWAKRQGAKGYLVKPADPRALIGRVRRVLAKKVS